MPATFHNLWRNDAVQETINVQPNSVPTLIGIGHLAQENNRALLNKSAEVPKAWSGPPRLKGSPPPRSLYHDDVYERRCPPWCRPPYVRRWATHDVRQSLRVETLLRAAMAAERVGASIGLHTLSLDNQEEGTATPFNSPPSSP